MIFSTQNSNRKNIILLESLITAEVQVTIKMVKGGFLRHNYVTKAIM